MKLFLISICLFVLVDSVSSGACVVTCTHDGSMECPAGTECRSNGCGQTCQPIHEGKRAECPPVLCKMYCELGFAKGTDGCPICSCVQPTD